MGNWYCRNCNSWEESWAEHQSYKKDEEYRRDKRCWKCDKWKLKYTDSQKERYERLVKQRTSVPGTVYQVNNGKGKEINLRDEINSWNSSRRFENLTSYKPSKIEEYEEQYVIQVPPKQDCRII